MLNMFQQKTNRLGDNMFAASRQVWLAGLGAAVVTRDWAEKEASGVFRTLVKEGTAVESRVIRIVGDRVESSVTKANGVLKQTRAAIETVVRVYSDTAVGLVCQSFPRLMPQSASAKTPASRPAKSLKSARNQTRRAARGTKAKSKR
ncbi:MAG TPA: phasin family protein [Casimicrobiaceae bacterium]|jgi:hypothetical protein